MKRFIKYSIYILPTVLVLVLSYIGFKGKAQRIEKLKTNDIQFTANEANAYDFSNTFNSYNQYANQNNELGWVNHQQPNDKQGITKDLGENTIETKTTEGYIDYEPNKIENHNLPQIFENVPSFQKNKPVFEEGVIEDGVLYPSDLEIGYIGVSKEYPIDNPSDNIFKIQLPNKPTGNKAAYLSYELYGVEGSDGVSRSINQNFAKGGHQVKINQTWQTVKEKINPKLLKLGENIIRFSVPKGATHGYQIKNLNISFEEESNHEQIVLNQQNIRLVKNKKVYISGYIKEAKANQKIAAGFDEIPVINGEFEGYIYLNNSYEQQKLIQLLLVEDEKVTTNQTFVWLDEVLQPADYQFSIETKTNTYAKAVTKSKASSVEIQGAKIDVPAGALENATNISITQLRSVDIPPLNSGMVNVTKGKNAYRFLPHGTKFKKEVDISIAYDPKLLPSGFTEKDIQTYFFNEETKRWEGLKKDSADVANTTIISKTTHFTDMINGVIQVPESPQTNAFAPTMMNDIKAADPSAAVNLIQPPSASQKGTANIGYPFKLPAGRNGMQPQLGLQYSNEGGSSWVGYGWSLSAPAITIDTRWGVPTFDPNNESEIYLLNGEQLSYPMVVNKEDNPDDPDADIIFNPTDPNECENDERIELTEPNTIGLHQASQSVKLLPNGSGVDQGNAVSADSFIMRVSDTCEPTGDGSSANNDTRTGSYTTNTDEPFMPNRHRIKKDSNGDEIYVTDNPQKRTRAIFDVSGKKVKYFTPRKKGSQANIQRFGDKPSNYRWIVTDENGTKSYYGGDEGGVNEAYVIRGKGGAIAHWALWKVEDKYGNAMIYEYLPRGGNLYCSNIYYTGKGDKVENYRYKVEFDRKNNNAVRKDVVVNGRNTVLQQDDSYLDNIRMYEVKNGKPQHIRTYKLNYKDGKFSKMLLESVSEYGEEKNGDGIFNWEDQTIEKYTHTFEYYNEGEELFSQNFSIDIPCPDSDDCGVADIDEDGIYEECDNCELHHNPNQEDADNNGVGDACEEEECGGHDRDKDGINANCDNCPIDYNPDQNPEACAPGENCYQVSFPVPVLNQLVHKYSFSFGVTSNSSRDFNCSNRPISVSRNNVKFDSYIFSHNQEPKYFYPHVRGNQFIDLCESPVEYGYVIPSDYDNLVSSAKSFIQTFNINGDEPFNIQTSHYPKAEYIYSSLENYIFTIRRYFRETYYLRNFYETSSQAVVYDLYLRQYRYTNTGEFHFFSDEIPVGLNTNISVNSSPMAGNPYNIYNNFTAFKSAFESQYPNSSVGLSGSGENLRVNISFWRTPDVYETIQVGDNVYNFTEFNCDDVIASQPTSNESAPETNDWANVEPTKEELEIAIQKWEVENPDAVLEQEENLPTSFTFEDVESSEFYTYEHNPTGESKWLNQEGIQITNKTTLQNLEKEYNSFIQQSIQEDIKARKEGVLKRLEAQKLELINSGKVSWETPAQQEQSTNTKVHSQINTRIFNQNDRNISATSSIVEKQEKKLKKSNRKKEKSNLLQKANNTISNAQNKVTETQNKVNNKVESVTKGIGDKLENTGLFNSVRTNQNQRKTNQTSLNQSESDAMLQGDNSLPNSSRPNTPRIVITPNPSDSVCWRIDLNLPLPQDVPPDAVSRSFLGSSKTKSITGGGSLGLGIGWNALSKSFTVNGGKNWTGSTSTSNTAQVDMNGNGLQDLVYASGGYIYYKPHRIVRSYNADGELEITHKYGALEPEGAAIQLANIRHIYLAQGKSSSTNVHVTVSVAPIGGVVGRNDAKSKNETIVYITDANGDQLPDISVDGTVLFNVLEGDVPTFYNQSKPTENMLIIGAAAKQITPAIYDPNVYETPKYDVVKVWEAPKDGFITIDNNWTGESNHKVSIETQNNQFYGFPNANTEGNCRLYRGTPNIDANEITSFGLVPPTLQGGMGCGCDDTGDDDNDGIPNCIDSCFGEDCSCSSFRAVHNAIELPTNPSGINSNSQCFRVTANQPWQRGAIWLANEVDLTKKVKFETQIYAGTNDGGADGFAIVLQNDPEGFSTIGEVGIGMGYENISPSVALEIDTFYNGPVYGEYDNTSQDHLAIRINGNANHNEASFGSPSILEVGNIENITPTFYPLTVEWDPSTNHLQYTFDPPNGEIETLDLYENIINTRFGGETKVKFGLTGSTGRQYNEQVVCIDHMEYHLNDNNSCEGAPGSIPPPPAQPNSSIYVKKGQKIFFRLHQEDDTNPEELKWNPAITYSDSSIPDQNGLDPINSSYEDSFILNGKAATPVIAQNNTTARITWDAVQGSTILSDDVTVEIVKQKISSSNDQNSVEEENIIWSSEQEAGNTFSIPEGAIIESIQNFTNTNSHNATIDAFIFRMKSNSNVNWKELNWAPKIKVDNTVPQEEGDPIEYTETFYPIVHYDLYKPANADFRFDNEERVHNSSELLSLQGSTTLNTEFGFILNNLGLSNFDVATEVRQIGETIPFPAVINLVIKKDGQKVGSDFIKFHNPNGIVSVAKEASIDYNASGRFTYEFYGNGHPLTTAVLKALDQPENYNLTIARIGRSILNRRSVQLFIKQPESYLGDFYRNWGQFAYNEDSDDGQDEALGDSFGKLINANKLKSGFNLTEQEATDINDFFNGLNFGENTFNSPDDIDQFFLDNPEVLNLLDDFVVSPLQPYRGGMFGTNVDYLPTSAEIVERWKSFSINNYTAERTMRSATETQSTIDQISQEFINTYQADVETGAHSINKVNVSKTKNYSGGLNISGAFEGDAGGSASVSGTWPAGDNKNHNLNEYTDVNGDRYPDVLDGHRAQLTQPTGGLNENQVINSSPRAGVGEYVVDSNGFSASGNFSYPAKPSANYAGTGVTKKPKFISYGNQNSAGISVNQEQSEDEAEFFWYDLNGDGLQERVQAYENTIHRGRPQYLSLGSPDYLAYYPGFQGLELSANASSSGGAGLGINVWHGSVEVGASLGTGRGHTRETIMDMNGDGLADKVVHKSYGKNGDYGNLSIYFNLGGKFATEPVEVENFNLGNSSSSSNSSGNVGASFSVLWPVLSWLGIPPIKYPTINGNGSMAWGTTKTLKSITDYDGDGYPDLVYESEDNPNQISVRYSKIKRTNMLKTVTNPLGGSFEIDYEVKGNTYDLPQSKWVMKSVKVNDGYTPEQSNDEDAVENNNSADIDGHDTYVKYFDYHNGRYDRREREFYGFRTVRTIDVKTNEENGTPEFNGLNTPKGDEVYRQNVTHFHNQSYFLNGMVKESMVIKGDPFTFNNNTGLVEITYNDSAVENSQYHGIEQGFIAGVNNNVIFSRSTNEYKLYKPDYEFFDEDYEHKLFIDQDAPQPINYDTGGQHGRGTAFVLMSKAESFVYNAQGIAPMSSSQTFEYDRQGRPILYKNHATNGEYTTKISYYGDHHHTYEEALKNHNIMSIPSVIQVFSGIGTDISNLVRERRVREIDNYGHITKIQTNLGADVDGANQGLAETEMVYDTEYGHLTNILYPENHKGERLELTYGYNDDGEDMFIYPTSVSSKVKKNGTVQQFMNYTSFTEYEYKYGNVLSSTDVTGNQMFYEYDSFGRVIRIVSPKEIPENGYSNYEAFSNSDDYTIKFEYHPLAEIPYAVTKHYDPQHVDNDIETITFSDGMARPIIVKKDIDFTSIENRADTDTALPATNEKMSVSGWAKYDFFGRAVENFHPGYEEKDDLVNLKINLDANVVYDINPETNQPYSSKVLVFDELDRALQAQNAEGTVSKTDYKIESGLLQTTSTVPQSTNGPDIVSHSYADVNGRTIKTVSVGPDENGTDVDIETVFAYDNIGQLITVTDAEGNVIESKYDLAGRRHYMKHPDAGENYYWYDQAGNLTKSQTPNLKDNNAFMEYTYQYSRPEKIIFPKLPSGADNPNNVTYKYGEVANTYELGRLIEQTDATGMQSFEYDVMGAMTKNTRTIVTPNPQQPIREFETTFAYDSWNRITKMVYPDEEEVTYTYDHGGNLQTMAGTFNKDDYNYIEYIGYDHYEQKVYQKHGNGTQNTYKYEPALRRLSNMKALAHNGNAMFNNTYTFDNVGNITELRNATSAGSNFIGGNYNHQYKYDKLNRLVEAQGEFYGYSRGSGNTYNLTMTYDKLHRIVSKNQTHNNGHGAAATPVYNNTYHNTYQYGGALPHAVQSITDGLHGANDAFVYDANGNMTQHTHNASTQAPNPTHRMDAYFWDEVNRLRTVRDKEQSKLHHYVYDANGERTLKASGGIEEVHQNGTLLSSTAWLSNYTVYASGYLVLDANQNNYTKHYFNGSQRIASVLEQGAERYNTTQTASYNALQTGLQQQLYIDFAEGNEEETAIRYLPQVENEENPPSFVGGNGQESSPSLKGGGKGEVLSTQGEVSPTQQQAASTPQIYFFHPDHLGTATMLSDANGDPTQFFLNLPFGETMTEQTNGAYNNPYKFNGKELDEETGFYYYGARYYNPKTSIWLSVDPIASYNPVFEVEHYIDGQHNGGVFNNMNLNVYGYTYQNPIIYIDPNGKQVKVTDFKRHKDGQGRTTGVSSTVNAKVNVAIINLVDNSKLNKIYTFINNKTGLEMSGNKNNPSTVVNSVKMTLKVNARTVESINDIKPDDFVLILANSGSFDEEEIAGFAIGRVAAVKYTNDTNEYKNTVRHELGHIFGVPSEHHEFKDTDNPMYYKAIGGKTNKKFNHIQIYDILDELYGGTPIKNGTKDIEKKPDIQNDVREVIKDNDIK